MTKPKTLEQLRAEKERAETQLLQEQHKLERLENRKKYLEKGERTKRTHRLCNLGGTIESLAPEVKDLTRTEMTELMEYIFSLSELHIQPVLYRLLQVVGTAPVAYHDTIAHTFSFALKDGFVIDGEPGFVLKPYDEIYVRKSPGFYKQQNVYVEGEVLFAGTYTERNSLLP